MHPRTSIFPHPKKLAHNNRAFSCFFHKILSSVRLCPSLCVARLRGLRALRDFVFPSIAPILALTVLFSLAACGPDYNAIANRLREKNMEQEQQLGNLKEKLAARDLTLKQLQEQLDQKLPRVQTLPADRLAQMFTVARIEIRSQSDAWEIDSDKKGQGLSGFRVFIRTYSDDGSNIPATGDLVIEAFELSPPPAAPARLGSWTFTPAQMKQNWYAGLGLNHFAFNCPWTTPPKTADIIFKATFTDALTGSRLEAHLNKKITLPKQP
jgi:hypothetical protein